MSRETRRQFRGIPGKGHRAAATAGNGDTGRWRKRHERDNEMEVATARDPGSAVAVIWERRGNHECSVPLCRLLVLVRDKQQGEDRSISPVFYRPADVERAGAHLKEEEQGKEFVWISIQGEFHIQIHGRSDRITGIIEMKDIIRFRYPVCTHPAIR